MKFLTRAFMKQLVLMYLIQYSEEELLTLFISSVFFSQME